MESNIDWTILTDITKDKMKNTICEEELTDEIKQFIKYLQRISLETLPRKNKSGKEKDNPWEIKTIKNRIKMLKGGKQKVKSKKRKNLLRSKYTRLKKHY